MIQTRQQLEKYERNHVLHLEEDDAACSLVYFDDTPVHYYV